MKSIHFAMILVLLISCTKSKNIEIIEADTNEIASTEIVDEDFHPAAVTVEIENHERPIEIYISPPVPIVKQGFNFKMGSYHISNNQATVLLTKTIRNNVDVRAYPSMEAEIIYNLNRNNDVILISSSYDESLNNERWFYVLYHSNEGEDILGWVLSQHVYKFEQHYSPIKFHNFGPGIRLSYFLNENEEIIVYPTYTQWNDYYIIIFGPFEHGFHYTNSMGVYIMDKETEEIKHITYAGSFEPMPNAWTVFTDDMKYLIQDSGSTPGIRGITVWRVDDEEIIYEDGYHGKNPVINNNTIEVVYSVSNWRLERGFVDEEIKQFAIDFFEDNPITQKMSDRILNTTLSYELMVRATINLDTGERIIIGGGYYLVD